MSSSQRKNVAYTPVARRPAFQCSHCICCFYSRAGLKSHVLAKHGTQATSDRASQTSSPASNQPSSPQHFDDEHDVEHPMDVQLPFHDDYDDGYGYNNDLDVDVDVQQPFPDTYNDGYNNDSDMDLHDLVLGKFGLKPIQTWFEPNQNRVSGFRFGKFLPKPNSLVSGFGLLKFLKWFQIWFKPQTVCTYNFFYSYSKLFRSVFNTYIYILH